MEKPSGSECVRLNDAGTAHNFAISLRLSPNGTRKPTTTTKADRQYEAPRNRRLAGAERPRPAEVSSTPAGERSKSAQVVRSPRVAVSSMLAG